AMARLRICTGPKPDGSRSGNEGESRAMNEKAGPLKMERTKRYTVYTAAIGVWLTGALWLIFHYFLQTKGKFGMQQNPLEIWWLKLHGAFSFASIFALGLLWGSHI